MLISERSSADSLSLIASLLTNGSLPDFGGKHQSYCKDTQSIPAQSPLNPDVRCFIIKTLRHSVHCLQSSEAQRLRGRASRDRLESFIMPDTADTHLNWSPNTRGYKHPTDFYEKTITNKTCVSWSTSHSETPCLYLLVRSTEADRK